MISFNEETFPYALLEGVGLTKEMIDDLPGHVLETIGNGGRSPLLPIEIPTKFGSVSMYSKFRITDTIMEDGRCGIVFYPQLIEADLNQFSDTEKELLLAGKTILTEMDFADDDESEHKLSDKCFVQLYSDTNHVFYVHSSVIGRNLKAVDANLDLSDEDMEKLSVGMLVTVTEPEFMTLGIDIFSDTGIFVCPGDENNWKTLVGRQLDKYNFGIFGCWINEDGKLRYVKEEDFDDMILEEQDRITQRNKGRVDDSAHLKQTEVEQPRNAGKEQEDNTQMTR